MRGKFSRGRNLGGPGPPAGRPGSSGVCVRRRSYFPPIFSRVPEGYFWNAQLSFRVARQRHCQPGSPEWTRGYLAGSAALPAGQPRMASGLLAGCQADSTGRPSWQRSAAKAAGKPRWQPRRDTGLPRW